MTIKKSKILTFFICAFALYTLHFALPALAQDETESTEGAQSVREAIRKRVEEKLAELSKNPKAVVGELKEITDTTLNITTKKGEALAATSDETKYFRVTKGKQTSIKFEELVLGDFTVVMGYRNGNNVLDARRVISYDANPVTERRAVFGTVRTNTDGDLTISTPSQDQIWTIQTDDDTEVTKKGDEGFEDVDIEEIKAGDRIIAAGSPNTKKNNTLVASKIHVIPGTAVGQNKTVEEDAATPTPTKKTTPAPTRKVTPTPTVTP